MKLLIGCGPDTDVRVIGEDLRVAGLPSDVEAIVLTVADLLPIPSTPEPADAPLAVRRAWEQTAHETEAAKQYAERAAVALRAMFPSWTIVAEAQVDAPAWAIVRKAEQWRPDLIVLCSNDRSMTQRFILGSVSQTVLTHAPGSVRIVRPRRRRASTVRLLIGLDCSEHANAAAAAVAARRWPPGSEVRLVTAVNPTLANILGFAGTTIGEGDAAVRGVEQAQSTLSSAGVSVGTALLVGDPKQVLLDEADRSNADCVFLGARGLRGVERILLGSVSSALAARAQCSVEIVRT